MRSIFACVTALWLLSSPHQGTAAEAVAARVSQGLGAATVEIDLTAPLAVRAYAVEAPPRIFIDLPDVRWAAPAPDLGWFRRLIVDARAGSAGPDASRLVLDLSAPALPGAVSIVETDRGATVSVEVERVEEAVFAASAGEPPVGRIQTAAAPIEDDGITLVAIDPGHGGRDPGAVAGEIEEKTLVLKYARAIAARLDRTPGFAAMLTRSDDRFVRLRDRVRIARAAGADVFISLHADALKTGDASGSSVFVLSDQASDAAAAELASSANRADQLAGVRLEPEEDDVARVLLDLSQRKTGAASGALGEALAEALGRRTEVLSGGRSLQAASFRVLKAPDIPSALVEIGFMSSEADRARLLSPEGETATVAAIVEGLVAWARAEKIAAATN